MLSEAARPYIDASVPVLREHGVAITTHFYASMFAAHPELKNIFNMGNQASGVQQQSLAAAVFAYAANYRNPDALTPVVERIVHKHASLGITAEHYPIVGKHLLDAIQAVLGAAATPDLLAAWGEAYGVLANVLIEAEKVLYAKAGVTPGELQTLVVKEVKQESDNVTVLLPGQTQRRQVAGHCSSLASTSAWPALSMVCVSCASTACRMRQSSRGGASASSAKTSSSRPASISNWLHDSIKAGDTLQTSAAFGDFKPSIDGEDPIVLLSAGVGITPMISVLNTLASRNPNRRVLFAHAARHGGHHPLRSDVRNARTKLKALTEIQFYETPQSGDQAGIDYQHEGRMVLGKLALDQLPDANIYLCGPSGFMQQQWKGLVAAGVAPSRIHREVFGPDLLEHIL